jgi:hypothetical protein
MPKKRRHRQRNIRYVDPGVTPMVRPKPLPVGEVHVAKMTRQLRRQAARTRERQTRDDA